MSEILPPQRGRCANVDYCTLAQARRVILLEGDARFLCPECGRKLVWVVLAPPRGRRRFGWLVGYVLILGAMGAGVWLVVGG